jgi:hypothetical protein
MDTSSRELVARLDSAVTAAATDLRGASLRTAGSFTSGSL